MPPEFAIFHGIYQIVVVRHVQWNQSDVPTLKLNAL
jgi:hypothetical protein